MRRAALLPGCVAEPDILCWIAGQLLNVPDEINLEADVLVTVALQQQQGAGGPGVLVELRAMSIIR